MKIAEALFTLFLACNIMNKFDIAEIKMLWFLRIKIWGAHFMSEFSIFSVMAGHAFHAVLCL